jgi:hypothetical protein
VRFVSVCSGIEAASVAWHPLGFRAAAFAEISPFPSALLAARWPGVTNHGDFRTVPTLPGVDLLVGGTPCQSFSVAGLRGGFPTNAVTSRLSIVALLKGFGLAGSSGKTCPVSCQATEGGTLVPSSGRWSNSGMGSPIECWTLSTSEYLSGGVASSLSDILETGDVPQRFFLSPRACAGILRRAKARGRELPETLRKALESAAA